MAADEQQVGQNILRAFRAVADTYRQVDSLIAVLDDAFEPHRLYATRRRLADEVGPRSGRPLEDWFATVLYRAYSNESEDQKQPADRLIALEVHLAGDDLEVPELVVAALKLREAAGAVDAWKAWLGLRRALQAHAPGESHPLDEVALAGCFKSASKGLGCILPLCRLDDRNVHDLVVQPALLMYQSL